MTGSDLLLSKLTYWAKTKGDNPAIIETDSADFITYKNLLHATAGMCHFLGKKSKKIMTALDGGIPNSVLWLSSLIQGHLLIPASAYLTSYEYQDLIKKHKPDIIISQTDNCKGNLNLDSLKTIISKSILKHEKFISGFKALNGSVFLSTSGSTGDPKGIILDSKKIVNTANNLRLSHHITKNDRGLTPLPFFHVNAPVVSLTTTILAGAVIIIAPKYSTSRFWSWIEQYDPTWISIVPTIVAMLLTTKKPLFLKKASVRFIRTASAPLPIINLKKFEKKFNIPLIETYGISEGASTITANPVNIDKRKMGSVGLPLGVEISIYKYGSGNNNLDKTATGKIGEICVRGKSIIKSYENNVSKESFLGKWFRTGDLGYIDKQGYVYITGRIKDVIIKGGEKIFPRDIEEVLLSYPNIQDAVVVGCPDPIYGEKIVGFIVLRKPAGRNKNLIESKIKKYASARLNRLKTPSQIYILDNLPRGKTGKIDKKTLRRYSL